MAVGVAQACLSEALRYAKGRHQFDQPIFSFQAVQFKLADVVVAIELARTQYLKAAGLKDKGRKHGFDASTAKLYASEMGGKSGQRCAPDSRRLRIYGGISCIPLFQGSQDIADCRGHLRNSTDADCQNAFSEVPRITYGKGHKERIS